MAVSVDMLLYVRRLRALGVDPDVAETHAELGRDVLLANVAAADDVASLANVTKAELTALRREVETAVRELQSSIRELKLRMTIKLGAIVAAGVALAAALQKLL